MFLETMNDEEKCFEAFRITPCIMQLHDENIHDVVQRLKKPPYYPYFVRLMWEDDKKNMWTLLYVLPSKEWKKKEKYMFMCYTIYEIRAKNAKERIEKNNAGKGIFLFNPFAMNDRANQRENSNACFIDIVPHAFNQFTKRYLEPKGKLPMTFNQKINHMLMGMQHFDVMGDESSMKHTDKGFAPHDIFMRGGGMLRGQYVNEILIRLFTYVGQDMLTDDQLEWQERMTKEYWHWKMKGIYV